MQGELVGDRCHDSTRDGAGSVHRHLLADDATHCGLDRIDRARRAPARRGCDERSKPDVAGQGLVDGHGIGFRSSSLRTRPTAGERSRQSDSTNSALTRTCRRAASATVPCPRGRSSDRRKVVPSQCSTPGTERAARNANNASPANGVWWRAGLRLHRPARSANPVGRSSAHLSRRRCEHFPNRVVELTNAAEAGREGDVGHRHVATSR